MTTPRIKRALMGLAVLLSGFALSAAATLAAIGVTTFQDHTFNSADWTEEEFWDENSNGTLSAGQETEGENSFRQVTHDWGVGTIVFVHLANHATYDPRTEGAITEVDFSYDVKAIGPRPYGTSISLLAVQGGRYFVYSPGHIIWGDNTTWTPLTGTEGGQFVEVSNSNGYQVDMDSHPDFSDAGLPIQFGFVTSNSIMPGTGVDHLTLVNGIDNWAVRVSHEEMEPDCSSLTELSQRVEGYGASGDISGRGLLKSLLAKLDAAQASVDRGNGEAFRGQLNAFINEVQAQHGKGIGAVAADTLIAEAQAILGGCNP